MAYSDQIETRPALLIDTDDITIASSIREFDRDIHRDPESYMQACRRLGGVATEHMQPSDDCEGAGSLTKEQAALASFLGSNLLRRASFDTESDEAIYDHPGVVQLSKAVQKERGQIVKQGGKNIHRENPRAVTLLSNLSALKIYLYADRVQRWGATAELSTSTRRNGAA